MIKQNYAFEKRQKEIAKKQKKQEKLAQKAAQHTEPPEPTPNTTIDDKKTP